MLDDYGLDRGVLLPPDRILNPPHDTDYREANEAVARAVATYPERLVGAIRLNPLFGEEFVRETVRYFVEERGLGGIKMVARADFYNPASLRVIRPGLSRRRHNTTFPSSSIPGIPAAICPRCRDTRRASTRR